MKQMRLNLVETADQLEKHALQRIELLMLTTMECIDSSYYRGVQAQEGTAIGKRLHYQLWRLYYNVLRTYSLKSLSFKIQG